MPASVHFSGPVRHRLRSLAVLNQSMLEVSLRRMRMGPRRPGWNWFLEVSALFLKRQVRIAFEMNHVEEARSYLDAVAPCSPAASKVNMKAVVDGPIRGTWFTPEHGGDGVTILYFHGGGYSFYPKAYAGFIAMFSLATDAKVFALDYRLAPENRFPAQQEDAVEAYCWLLNTGVDPKRFVVAGDSAGGHLTLAGLLTAREAKLPLPALAIALSPPTDFARERVRIDEQSLDWIDGPMLEQWADWFCDPDQRKNPMVSPVLADLRGLPPIYVQAGRAEILYDSIQAFVDRSRAQGADITLDIWDDMLHDFQIFGSDVPQSAESLRRLRQVIDARVGRAKG